MNVTEAHNKMSHHAEMRVTVAIFKNPQVFGKALYNSPVYCPYPELLCTCPQYTAPTLSCSVQLPSILPLPGAALYNSPVYCPYPELLGEAPRYTAPTLSSSAQLHSILPLPGAALYSSPVYCPYPELLCTTPQYTALP